MEQHPVPQNVTTFQFRLIGDMTIKQFGYLAAGAILAYIFYKLPLPFFINWPLAIFFALSGFGFAFVPIEERPMDVWVFSFFRNIYSPTVFIWKKSTRATPQVNPTLPQAEAPRVEAPLPQAPQAAIIETISGPVPLPRPQQPITPSWSTMTQASQPIAPPMDTRPQAPTVHSVESSDPFAWFKNLFRHNTRPHTTATIKPSKAQSPIVPPIEQPKDYTIQQTTQIAPDTHIAELQKKLQEALSHKQTLESELTALRQEKTVDSHQKTINIISSQAATKAGLPRLTTFPNVVTGIVKDAQNILLPGVLITVRDKNDIPLRALKTNKLGQFAASTPLPPNTYMIEIEDPRGTYTFDRVQITLNGTIMPAIEIIAKSQKELSRQKLAQEIFGSQKM